MANDAKPLALRALRLSLRPIVRVLLRLGITWKAAAEVCKTTLVEVAAEDFGLHGRPTNNSRIAIMTGLSRREVARLRKALAQETPPDLEDMNNATQVLSAWHLDGDYLDADGRPVLLEFAGDGPTFSRLVGRHAPDIPPVTMLRELLRIGAIAQRADGTLRVRQRYYMPLPMDPQAILRGGTVLQDIGETINYNLARREDQMSRFEGRATNVNVKATDIPAFREFLEAEGQGFLERVDEWLSRHEAPTKSRRSMRKVRLGAGLYQIDDSNN